MSTYSKSHRADSKSEKPRGVQAKMVVTPWTREQHGVTITSLLRDEVSAKIVAYHHNEAQYQFQSQHLYIESIFWFAYEMSKIYYS